MGSDARICEIMKKLSGDQFKVNFIVIPPLRALAGAMDKSLEEHLARSRLETPPEGIDVSFVEVPSYIEKLWASFMPIAYLLTLCVCLFTCIKNLKQIRPDMVVLAHPSYLCGLVGLTSAKILNLDVVLDYPDLWTPLTIETLSWSPTSIRSIILEKLEQYIVKFADSIVAITSMIHNKVTNFGVATTKTAVIPNGIAYSEIVEKTSAQPTFDYLRCPPKILYSGRLERWTNLEILINAAPIVLRDFPSTKFVIMGDGTYRGDLQDLIFDLKLQDNFVLTGYVKQEQVWDSINSATVCVNTFSKSDVSNAAIPIKVLEYAVFCKPIVATKSKSMSEFLRDGENALIVDPDDPKMMAFAISTLLKNSDLAKHLGTNVNKLVKEQFNWEYLAQNFGKICWTAFERKYR